MSEVQKADPRARARAFIILVLASVSGSALILAGEMQWGAITRWLARDPEKALLRLELFFGILAVCLTCPVFVLSIYIWRLGRRIATAGLFPPPGLAVVHDTPVLSGRAARIRGRLLQVCAGLMIGAAGAILLLFREILSRLGRCGA